MAKKYQFGCQFSQVDGEYEIGIRGKAKNGAVGSINLHLFLFTHFCNFEVQNMFLQFSSVLLMKNQVSIS